MGTDSRKTDNKSQENATNTSMKVNGRSSTQKRKNIEIFCLGDFKSPKKNQKECKIQTVQKLFVEKGLTSAASENISYKCGAVPQSQPDSENSETQSKTALNCLPIERSNQSGIILFSNI